MNAKEFEYCLDDLLRSFGGYEQKEGRLPPGPDGRYHLDISHENYVALLTSLRWSMQNISDFEKTQKSNNDVTRPPSSSRDGKRTPGSQGTPRSRT